MLNSLTSLWWKETPFIFMLQEVNCSLAVKQRPGYISRNCEEKHCLMQHNSLPLLLRGLAGSDAMYVSCEFAPAMLIKAPRWWFAPNWTGVIFPETFWAQVIWNDSNSLRQASMGDGRYWPEEERRLGGVLPRVAPGVTCWELRSIRISETFVQIFAVHEKMPPSDIPTSLICG